MTALGTVRLAEGRVVCAPSDGASVAAPLLVEVTAIEAAQAARDLARRVWHRGVRLARPRYERGAVTFDVREGAR